MENTISRKIGKITVTRNNNTPAGLWIEQTQDKKARVYICKSNGRLVRAYLSC